MSRRPVSANVWTGSVAMLPGIGAFLGVSGDNKPHKHWAHQLAIGLDENIKIQSAGAHFIERGLWIPAGTSHQLKTATVLCIYIDSTHDLCKTLFPKITQNKPPITALSDEIVSSYLRQFSSAGNLQKALGEFNIQCRCTPESVSNRLQDVLTALHAHASLGCDISRTELAEMAHY